MAKEYEVISNIKSLSFLNGYVCEANSKGHFLRHLGIRFSKCCSMGKLNNAYKSGDIVIDIHKPKPIIVKKTNPNIVDEYWGNYGYILEVNHGSVNRPIIEKRAFVNDIEALQWVNAQ